MSAFNIQLLKNEQDLVDQRSASLRAEFLQFRKHFFATLEKLSIDAIQAGLRGIEKPRKQTDKEELLQFESVINDHDLTIVGSDSVYLLDFNTQRLAAKIFAYLGGDESSRPLVEIIFKESEQGEFFDYGVKWFTSDGERLITGLRRVNEASAEEAAQELLHFFYRLQVRWIDRPSLQATTHNKDRRIEMGFVPGNREEGSRRTDS
jgi:hypothetical protein